MDCPLSQLHTAAACIILAAGVCRTPPVRGKGGAHLSRSVAIRHADLSSAHDADTGALLKEVVRVHAEASHIPVNLEQQRKLAKDLLRAARERRRGSARAHPGRSLGRWRRAPAQACRRAAGHRPRGRLRLLAEARRAISRSATSRHFATPCARRHSRGATVPRDYRTSGTRINDPMFDFGQRAAHVAAKNAAMLQMLIAAGADVNLKSEWENGPYTVLDNATEDTARFLLARGATLTPNVAARLGWFDELRTMIDARRAPRARARRRRAAAAPRGENGCDRRPSCWNAARESMCAASITSPRRHSTRWSIVPTSAASCSSAGPRRTSSWRHALATSRSGNAPDGRRPILRSPRASTTPGYPPVPPFNIYCWTLGFGMSPHEVALKFGHRDVHDLLAARSPARVRFVNALLTADEHSGEGGPRGGSVALPFSDMPGITRHLAQAIFHERFDAADLMLTPRVRPCRARGRRRDGAPCRLLGGQRADGSSVCSHAAAYRSTPGIRPIRARRSAGPHSDPSIAGPAGADYPAVAERLVAAGADITMVGNGAGRTLLEMAHGNRSMQDALRRLGAT